MADGVTLMPWNEGRRVTLTDTMAQSYLPVRVVCRIRSGGRQEVSDYSSCWRASESCCLSYSFIAIATETMAAISSDGITFLI